jgi:uncharacterized membrane protein YeaQ/YmgE (transglycosylase-associated protein family)
MLNFVAWIVAGGVLGYAASRLVRGHTAPGALLNILAGVVGGFVSGLVMKTVLFGLTPAAAHFSLVALVSALGGAALLLMVVNMPVRGHAP